MKRKIKCPNCKRETLWEGNPYRPFCSYECKMADLHRWLTQEYLVAENLYAGEEVEREDNAGT
ncbi:DNA gyrase inhibitor YacG [Thermovibrio sp.]